MAKLSVTANRGAEYIAVPDGHAHYTNRAGSLSACASPWVRHNALAFLAVITPCPWVQRWTNLVWSAAANNGPEALRILSMHLVTPLCLKGAGRMMDECRG